MAFFTETKKNNHTIHIDTQKTPIAKAILTKKNNAGDITIPDFRLYYRAIITKRTCTGMKTEM
jgi:hypothetical protein